jgi:hypothetical protein
MRYFGKNGFTSVFTIVPSDTQSLRSGVHGELEGLEPPRGDGEGLATGPLAIDARDEAVDDPCVNGSALAVERLPAQDEGEQDLGIRRLGQAHGAAREVDALLTRPRPKVVRNLALQAKDAEPTFGGEDERLGDPAPLERVLGFDLDPPFAVVLMHACRDRRAPVAVEEVLGIEDGVERALLAGVGDEGQCLDTVATRRLDSLARGHRGSCGDGPTLP